MEDYSVRAVLSATDRGFTSALKNANSALSSMGTKVKSGIGFGVLMSAGQSAFNAVTNGVKGMVHEIDDSNKAWKTFEGNMKIMGKSAGYTKKARKEMEDFAAATIYDASEMAGTFSQLAAVGTKNTAKLVKGFGGLAASAENPKQAMKTLSQQATQMAARPTVAWQDYKLMLDQAPAGMAAVAKKMGKSAKELTADIQAGKVSTNDFFEAIEEVGNSKGFSNLAKQYKTVGEATDGLKENLAQKLGPAFEIVSQKGIEGIEKIISKIDKIDAGELADKVSGFMKKAEPYWDEFTEVVNSTGKAIKKVGKFLSDHSDTLSKMVKPTLAAVGAYKGFKVVSKVVGPVKTFTNAIGGLASKKMGKMADDLADVADGTTKAGDAGKGSAKNILAVGGAFALMGGGVLEIAAGFKLLADSSVKLAEAGGPAVGVMAGMAGGVAALGFGMGMLLKTLAPLGQQLMPAATALLALGGGFVAIAFGFQLLTNSSIKLAEAGWPAVAVMVGMVGGIAALAFAMSSLGPALDVASLGMLALGGMIALAGAGIYFACSGITKMCEQLPVLAEYGGQAALALAGLGLSLSVFGMGAGVAGIGMLGLGLGLGACAIGVGALALTTGALFLALKGVNSSVKSIAKNARTAASTLRKMQSSVKVTGSALDALGDKANSAMNGIKGAFKRTVGDASRYGKEIGSKFTSGMKSTLSKAPREASRANRAVLRHLKAGKSSAYNSGAMLSVGFANGMRSELSSITAAADAIVAQADRIIRKKGEIHSPSRLTEKLGSYFAEGWVNGIESKIAEANSAVARLMNVPAMSFENSNLTASLSDDYNYAGGENVFYLNVTSEIDGQLASKQMSKYVKADIAKQEERDRRKKGKI